MSVRRRREEFASVQEWFDHKRSLARIVDARRRAKRAAEGPQKCLDDRRAEREAAARRANPPPSAYALDTVVFLTQTLAKNGVSSSTAAEVIDERVKHLRKTIESPTRRLHHRQI